MTKIPLREGADSGTATSSRTAPTNESHAQHSPLPFGVTDRNGSDDTAECGIDCADGWAIADLWADVEELQEGVALANAEFIVRACNSFDDLLAALKTTRLNILSLGPAGALDRLPQEYRVWLAVVDAAIAKAEGR